MGAAIGVSCDLVARVGAGIVKVGRTSAIAASMSGNRSFASRNFRFSSSLDTRSSPRTGSLPVIFSAAFWLVALWHEAKLWLKFAEVHFAHSGQKEEACLRAGSCPAMTGCELSDSSRDRRAVDFLKCVPAANQIEPFIHKAINAPNGNVLFDKIY